MVNTAAGKTHTVSRRFVISWILSLVVPGLILMALRGLLLADPTWELGRQFALMAPLPVWFLIGFIQYRLLRPYRRRSLWWLVATFAGGILGMFVGGPAMIMMMPPSEIIVLSSTTTPEWMFAPYPLPPAAFAGAIAAAVLGSAQAPSLGQGFRRGMFWILLSALSGAAAAFVGGLAHWAYAHAMSETYPAAVEANISTHTMIALSIAIAAGLGIYGLATGFVMRWMLNNGVTGARA
ncbi:MAG: hypothetical protein ACKVOI_11035 [Dongiaceae bacterium]